MLLLDLLEKYSGYNHKRWTSQSESAFSQDPFFQTIALFRFILIAKLVRLVACEGDHAMRAVVSCYKYHLDLKRDTSILEVFVRVSTIKATWKVLTSRRAEKWTRLFDVFRCNLQAPSLDWQIQAIKQSHESVHLRAFHRDVFFGAAFGQTANKKTMIARVCLLSFVSLIVLAAIDGQRRTRWVWVLFVVCFNVWNFHHEARSGRWKLMLRWRVSSKSLCICAFTRPARATNIIHYTQSRHSAPGVKSCIFISAGKQTRTPIGFAPGSRVTNWETVYLTRC